MFNCNFYDLTGSTSRDFTSERGTCALAEARLTFTRSRFPDAPVLQRAKPCGQAQENGMPSREWESRRRQGSRRMDAKVILKLQEMHFVRQPSSTCSFRANMTPLPALWMLEMLTKRQIPKGRFTIAAKHHITIAEIYETELVDIEKAIAHYEQSADYYKGEESNSSANKSLLKVAAYAAQLEQYQKAIEIYEQVLNSRDFHVFFKTT
ncbi:alpha-soluble NSF attachment protein-like isoform X1 [Chlorocebus sabaeus]|uniref:alpha-soluble NSF attachment protein-like isoform X1 n=2 Tax=Chlorocebus sabaeus TaxID=60711 RepID=UPI003BF9E56E